MELFSAHLPALNAVLPDNTASPQTDKAASLLKAGESLLPYLATGTPLNSSMLRAAMEKSFGATDATGAWVWKDAYEAIEIAQALFLKRYLPGMRKAAKSPADLLAMIAKIAALIPTHTKRSDESVGLQQFSTPLELACIASIAAAITPDDLVLEPSAGTGQLAVFASTTGAAVALNEWSATRADILRQLLPDAPVTRHDAENIDDYLESGWNPSVIIMNPPFSAAPGVNGTMAGVDMRHIRSALRRLAPGGRLVAITSAGLSPLNPTYAKAFEALEQAATLRYSAGVSGKLFQRHGTTITTRLSVFDKHPASQRNSACTIAIAETPEALLHDVLAWVPPREPCTPVFPTGTKPANLSHSTPVHKSYAANSAPAPTAAQSSIIFTPQTPDTNNAEELHYEIIETPAAVSPSEALYQPYAPERIFIPGAKPHPTKLVQSAAMASVKPPKPTYRPLLPTRLITDGILSDAQLESIVYAGEAHARRHAGHWLVDENLDYLTAADPSETGAVQFRRGWFLGDGTGAGKGRQVAGIVLDNWLRGRRKAVWVSKSDTLLEDARRDWSALGQEQLLIVPQSRFRHGSPITLTHGILFTTYATLRSSGRETKASRLQQIIDWLGRDFDGVIIFDESHAMGNAAPTKDDRGAKRASQQGISGLRLQHALHDARVVYVSATGATIIENLAYAQRLGLWGSDDLPFTDRADFVTAMNQGGIATSEVMARDLKSLGLYTARSLSYEGIVVDMLEHKLTPQQVEIYDAYARAYQVIHANLNKALEAAHVIGEEGGTLNKLAKTTALSAFESTKQRFFNHLITAMSVPSLITAMEANLAAGEAPVIQLVSTAEALMDRRLAELPPEEHKSLSYDITPREYMWSYLKNSFPTQLYKIRKDEKGNECSEPVYDADGHAVESREAVAARDAMMESLQLLPPVQAALDQIIFHFGTDKVAEVTGRSRRVVKTDTPRGAVFSVQSRPASSNIAETQAFMDDKKQILVFSDAGGTGRSYHADLGHLNKRPRIHYLLESGWKADTAVQGLGRTNRTNQAQPPCFRPVTTDVRGQKRFLSTIARRLDSLGAITRGQRQTGGQGLFRPSDNLESTYARESLRVFYSHLKDGHVKCISLKNFAEITGLQLTDKDGTLLDELPPIQRFLNRLLALQIGLQNQLFEYFEKLLETRIEQAIAAGTYDMGLETIHAESLTVADRQVIATNAATGAETALLKIRRKDRNTPIQLDSILRRAKGEPSTLLINTKSKRAALQVRASSLTLDDGAVQHRVRLIRPTEAIAIPVSLMDESNWEPCDETTFSRLWNAEVAALPEFTESTFHVMSGLLLPYWKRLPRETPRVYRFTTDDGQPHIGRLVPTHIVATFAPDAIADMNPDEAWQHIIGGGELTLTDGLSIDTCKVMKQKRVEVSGFTAGQYPHLKTLGLFSETIAYKLRLFIPNGEGGPAILAKLLARHPLLRNGV